MRRVLDPAVRLLDWAQLRQSTIADGAARLCRDQVQLQIDYLRNFAKEYGIGVKDIRLSLRLSRADAQPDSDGADARKKETADRELRVFEARQESELRSLERPEQLFDAGLESAKRALDNVAANTASAEELTRAVREITSIMHPRDRDQPLAQETRANSKLLPSPAGHEEAVRFSCCYPKSMPLGIWSTVLAYVYLPRAERFVKGDSTLRLGTRGYAASNAEARLSIARGAEIIAVPRLPGVLVNPPRASINWLEDWHRFEFRVMAEPMTGAQSAAGAISFYVGPVLVAEVGLSILLSESPETKPGKAIEPDTWGDGCAYQAIFVSYCHDDATIVDKLEQAYRALGIDFLRDSRILRSGVDWRQTLLQKIEDADIFQLCWSNRARLSRYVEEEWRHAASLGRPFFLRPVYWERPMPLPPDELAHIHFAYLDW